MATANSHSPRAENREEIAPLVDLCRAGHLFEVQQWIGDGKPVNPPTPVKKGTRAKSPLEWAIEHGFHSLVQVLLEGGALQEPDGYDSPMNRALRAKRFDIVQLLVEHGFDPRTVDMREVFGCWEPQIMRFFIDRGGDIERGNPFAWALCNRIRTALKLFKECRARNPAIGEQGNIALRHHCMEGNLKWVSLMLWAGADPYKPGTDNPDEKLEDESEGLSALGFAALDCHFEVFELKPIRSRPPGPEAVEFISYLTRGEGLSILRRLLEKGLNPNDQASGGCSAIQSCLDSMSWTVSYNDYLWGRDREKRKLDTDESRDRLKAIHLLAKHGAKWVPDGKYEMNSSRRALLRLVPDYTVEFVWIMSKFRACAFETIQELLRTPTMKAHTAAHRARIQEIIAGWSETL